MKVVGIDVGLKGGLACIDTKTNEVITRVMPKDLADLVKIISEMNPDSIYIEHVHAMPKQGVVSMFNFGFSYGYIMGICNGLGYVPIPVRPQVWKEVVLPNSTKDKQASIEFVESTYPSVELIQPRCRKPHDGIADAICIAQYGVNQKC